MASAVLLMPGMPGEDHQVGRLQAAHVAVEIDEAGGDAAQIAVALIRPGGHVDRGLQRVREALEAAVVASALGDLVEAALGLLDLFARARIDRRVIGDIDRVLADQDEFAPDRQVIDGAAVIIGVDDGGGLGGEAREILRHGGAADVVIAEKGLHRDRRGELAGADQRSRDLEDAPMNLLDEMLAAQIVGDAIEGVVVDEDRPEQRLLGLDVVRRGAVSGLCRIGNGHQPPRELFDGRHVSQLGSVKEMREMRARDPIEAAITGAAANEGTASCTGERRARGLVAAIHAFP